MKQSQPNPNCRICSRNNWFGHLLPFSMVFNTTKSIVNDIPFSVFTKMLQFAFSVPKIVTNSFAVEIIIYIFENTFHFNHGLGQVSFFPMIGSER